MLALNNNSSAMPSSSIWQAVTSVSFWNGAEKAAQTFRSLGLSSFWEARTKADALFQALTPQVKNAQTCSLPSLPFQKMQQPQCFALKDLEADFRRSMANIRPNLLMPREEMAGYGNKHRNLVQMDRIDQALDLKDLEIPAPKGIASDAIEAFLQSKAPEVFHHWQILKELYAKHNQETPFLKTPEAQHHLSVIESAIERAFSSGADFVAMPRAWLKEREAAGEFLMVRSTGAEDSHTIANAGGNVSRAYVRATSKAFMEAAGSVVKSYFGIPSLQNRIDGGGNPFEEKLQLAVTAQPLIGEPVGGAKSASQIPVSFVLFTNEPLYIGEEKFRAMRLSASYGHGEGVVSGQGIGTDSVLLLQSESHPDQLYTIYDNQRKLERLAPLQQEENVVLGKIANPKHLVNQPALSQAQLAAIYRSGFVMESFFKEPTDIEGVVKGGRIYFVQARPINRRPLLPTYLKKSDGIVSKVQTEPLVVGNASVVVISEKENVLVAPTLQEAERLFHAKKRGTYTLIVVSHPEPQNSHPVVNFSSLGVPCLYAPDQDAVRELLDKIDEDHPLAACMQTATLNLWDSQKANLQEAIQEGFAVHPAKIAISLPVSSHIISQRNSEEERILTELVMQLRGKVSLAQARPILDQIAAKTQDLKEEISRREVLLQGLSFIPKEVTVRIDLLKALVKEIEGALEETTAILQAKRGRLQRLLQLKVLETLLMQSNAKGAVSQYSLLDAKQQLRSLDLLIEYQNKLSHQGHCTDLLLAGERAASPEAFHFWRTFLEGLETLIQNKTIRAEELQQFRSIVSTLQKTGALSNWIAFLPEPQSSFLDKALFFKQEPFRELVLFRQILQENTPTDLRFMQELSRIQDSLEEMHRLLDSIADPKTHAKARQELVSLIDRLSSKDWLDRIQSASFTTRSVAYKVMQQSLDFIDSNLKALKMSSLFDLKTKATLFKEMLFPYFQLIQSWALQVPKEQITNHPDWPLDRYLNEVLQVLERLDPQDRNALMPSQRFSVAAAILNARTPFYRHQPRTLEDMLTLLHQNGLAWISGFNQALFSAARIEQSRLPHILKQAMQEIETKNLPIRIQRIGIDIGEKEVSLHYNVPLNNHNGQIHLVYDVLSSNLTMHASLVGLRGERWADIGFWMRTLENVGIYSPVRPIYVGEQEVRVCWDVSSGRLSSALQDYLSFATSTLATDRDPHELRAGLTVDRVPASTSIQLAQTMFQSKDDLVRSRALNLFENLFKKGQGYEAAIDVARKSLQNNDAVQLFTKLFQRNRGYEAAIKTAQEGSRSTDVRVRRNGLELFKVLVKAGQGYKAAIAAAQEGVRNDEVLGLGLQLFIELVQKGQGYEAAIDAARKSLQNNDAVQLFIKLFQRNWLFQRNRGYEAAIKAAQEGSRSTDVRVRRNGLELFKELVKAGQGHKAAIGAAQEGVGSTDTTISQFSFEIFRELVKKGQGYEAAIAEAQKGHRSASKSVRTDSLLLFKELMQKGQGYEAAIKAAQEEAGLDHINDKDAIEVFQSKADLFGELIQNGQGYEAAITTARKWSQNTESQKSGSLLFRGLIHKGQGYEAAITTAREWSQNTESGELGFSLFRDLIEKGQGYEAAITTAREWSQNTDGWVRFRSVELFRDLIEKGQGFEAAITTAREWSQSTEDWVRSQSAELLDLCEKNRPTSIFNFKW